MKSKLLILFSFLSLIQIQAQNLITNPGFETGGSGIGFVTNGAGYTQLVTPFSGTTVPGNFGVANFPKRVNTADFNFEGDRTTGAGRMLIIDGNTTPGTPFWSAGNTGGGVTTAVVGTTYYFSYWIKSVSDLVTDPTTQANIDVQVTGGNLVTLLSGNTLAPLPADGWKQVLYSFVATATTVQISLSNSNGNAVGNDFAVDDFVLRSSLILTANATNALCAVPNDGSITATAFGGTAPYTYTLSGAGTGTNTTGIFTGLAPGVYTVAVVDSATPTAASTTLTNIVVGPRLSITANTAICIGSSATLEVGGSPSTYTWTASPADSSLTTPNSDTVVVTPLVTTTYTATSTVGSCAPLTRTVQVTVNQLPVATLPADITICPGNSASVTITGTPQSTVTLVDYGTFPNPTTYTVNIPASGTVNWVTPALQETHTYTMTNVRNFFTFCERQYTNEEIIILVIPNGCATVETVPAPGTKPLDLTLCTTNECRTLEANISDVPSTTSYAVTSIPFCPQAPFENPSWIQLYPLPPTDTRTLGDDDWHDVFNFPAGMNFCFFGNNYTSLQVGTNGIITFKYHPQDPGPPNFPTCRWDYNLPIPNTNYVDNANLARDVSNSIMGVYQDTNFAVPNQAPNFKNINYQVVGTYPCRKFIVNYKDLPQFSCGNNIGVSTTQIVLYEVSNIIEVYVLRRTACTGWNGGRGTIGIMDATGTQGYAAPGRNAVPFDTDPTPSDPNNFDNVSEAWRFTPTGPNIPMSVSWYEGTTQIGTGPTVTVCPSATTTYTLKTEYSICNVIQTATSSVTLNVNPDLTNSPVNLTECSNIFNLEENTPIILGGLSPSQYEITYHLTAADADILANPISSPTTFTSNGQTIYAAIFLNQFGCIIVKPFQLIVDDCGPVTPPDLTLCETSYGSADAIFDLTPQIAVALGLNDPADYVVTLHLNLADANGDVSPISPTNNFTGVNGQEIFVRMESSTDPTQFEITSFNLIVNPIPTATISGTTSICEGDTATITFTGTPNAVVTYTINSGSNQTIPLDATGNATISMAFTADTTYTLVSVQNPTTLCSQTLTGSAVVTVNPIPTATISGTTTICEGDNATVSFTGTPNTVITYTVNSGANQQIPLGATGTASITAGYTVSTTYTLVSVQNPVTLCSQSLSGSATITVNVRPTATISGTTTICSGDSATVTFTGTPGAVVNYLVNPGTTGSVTLDASGSTTITSAYTTSTSYTLINVTNPATTCSQLVGGIATITVNPLPTATISGTTTVCQGTANPSITFTGANATAPYTFTYLDQNNATQTITTTVGNSVTVPVSTANGGTFNYQLLSVSSASTPACSQPQSGTATVTVVTLPTASISGTATTCLNFAEPQVVLTGFNGTAPYTFTYSLDTVVQPPVTSTGNSYTINVPTTASGTFVYQLISVASSGTPVCSQPQTGTVTIVVNDAPIINTPTPFEVCDDSLNNNGIYCYDLTQKSAEISTDPNVVITYHETPTDAQTGANPLTGLYCNIVPGAQTIYVRAHFNGSPACYANTTLELQINPLPLANPVITDYALCDYNNPGDEEEVFTLDTKTLEIANGQTGVTVTYYATQTDAQNQTNGLPNSYTNTSNPQQIWINISDNVTGCNTVSSFNLVVNPLPLAVTPLPINECSTGSSITQAEFDLTVNENVITGGVPGMIVTYYNSLIDAQTPQNPITPATAYLGNDNEIIHVRVQNIATGCYSTTTQLLRVTQGPTAVTPTPLERCDPNNDGFEVFDLTLATNQIAGGTLPPDVTVTYHETETDALLGSNPLSSPYANITPNQQTIYVKVFFTTTGCSNYVELELIVNPTPEATEPTDYHLCDYTGAVGYESFNLTTKIAEILGSINAATHTVTFYTDFTQAQLGTGNITNVTAYTNGTINQETLYVRVENNTTRCYDIVTLDLIVDPLPNSTQPSYPPYSLCDLDQSNIGYEIFDLASKVEEVLLGQTGMSVTFYPSLTDAQNNTSAITTPTYQNTTIYVQTLGIRITNNATGCYVISTMDIRVEPLPEPIPPTTPYIICDDNQDGFADFDLSTLITDILGGENYIITFHETEDNAITNDNALSTTNYTNINPFVQILYVRAEDPDTGCFSVMPITLEVNPSPVAPINLDNIEVCDTNANNQNGIMTVDLTIRTPDALAQQPLPASNYTVEYYTSQIEAEAGNLPIIPADNYSASNGQTIWVRVENNATGCYNLGTFQVIVGIPLVVPTPQPINECDTLPNDQFAVFDLTVRQITALPGYTFQYYPSLLDAQNDTNQITTITSYTNVSPAVQTLGVRIISAQGCVGYTTLNIRVLPAPEPNTNPTVLPAVCENATNSGQAIVDLTQNQAYILNGDTNLTLQYYPTLTDLENNTNEITNPSAALVGDTTLTNDPINLVQYVYIAVSGNNTIDHTGRNCYTVVPQGYIINPLPTVDIVGTNNVYQICESDPTGNDNTEVFDLTSQIPDLLEGNQTTPVSTYSVAFYETTTGSPIANPSAYTNTSNPQTIYVVITNTTTGCQSAIGNFDLQVNPKPIVATQLADFASCDDIDGVNDGQTLYFGNPLSDYIDDVLGAGQSPTDYTVTFYYNSQSDAEAGLNPIQDLATYQVQTGTYWVRIENNLTGCYITDSFDVIVEQLAEPNIVASTNIACVDFGETTVNNTLILDSQVTGNYTFEWYADGNLIAGETGPTLTVTEVTQAQVVFSVIAISNSALQCASDTTPDRTRFTVIRSGLASNVTYTVTNAFSEQQIITVTNDGYGIYHYSLDDGPILDNGGIFTNVPLGPHTVHVWDMRDPNGFSCGVVSIEGVQIIDYPHYFTPNGDGYHDTWNIKGLENFADATKIYIFDRYGKLLKQISSKSDGWDGTFNGQLMPSTDYWFKVEYPEAGVMKEFKAHFSLKR